MTNRHALYLAISISLAIPCLMLIGAWARGGQTIEQQLAERIEQQRLWRVQLESQGKPKPSLNHYAIGEGQVAIGWREN